MWYRVNKVNNSAFNAAGKEAFCKYCGKMREKSVYNYCLLFLFPLPPHHIFYPFSDGNHIHLSQNYFYLKGIQFRHIQNVVIWYRVRSTEINKYI